MTKSLNCLEKLLYCISWRHPHTRPGKQGNAHLTSVSGHWVRNWYQKPEHQDTAALPPFGTSLILSLKLTNRLNLVFGTGFCLRSRHVHRHSWACLCCLNSSSYIKDQSSSVVFPADAWQQRQAVMGQARHRVTSDSQDAHRNVRAHARVDGANAMLNSTAAAFTDSGRWYHTFPVSVHCIMDPHVFVG